MKLKRQLVAAALTLAVVAFGMVRTGGAQTNTTAPAPVPTQVVIVGTLHGFHKENTNYSLTVLRKVITAMKPAAILVERPPEIGGRPTVRDGRAASEFNSLESTAANLAADELDVNVIPYDREGRKEFYEKTHYFARQQAAYARLQDWLQAQRNHAPGSIPLQADRLETEAQTRQNRLMRAGGPELINSPAHDMVIVTKHGIAFGMMPRLLLAAGERELAEEFLFLNNEWQERNQIMARNIREIARKFAGKRLIVLAGAEHRYILCELLAKAPEVELKEFYQVPEWTGIRPLALAGVAPKDGDAAAPGAGQRSSARKSDAAAAVPGETLVGIGVELNNGYPDIKQLFPGSPAESSGQLHPGDRVVGVAQGSRAFVDTHNLSLQEVVESIRGKSGTTVRLQVLPADAAPGTPPRTISLARRQYNIKP